MNKNKFYQLTRLCCMGLLLAFTACSDDKGNYDYKENNVIQIEQLPKHTALLANAEYIDIKPVVTSVLEGTIEANNPNYEFSYDRKVDGKWKNICKEKDLYMLAELGAGRHDFLFTVTDKRTNVKTVELFRIDATTITAEGWMVLCNEGQEEKVRMDMLSNINTKRIVPAYNVVEFDEDVPALTHATQIGFYKTKTRLGGEIMILTPEAAYQVPTADNDAKIDGELLKVRQMDELKLNKFLSRVDDHIVYYQSIPINPITMRGAAGRQCASICVSAEGNAYAWYMLPLGGGFEYAINTDKRGEKPQYRVAPCVGRSHMMAESAPDYGLALLYDIDNHRFIGWDTEGAAMQDPSGKSQKCYPLTDPENKKFSYNTGNMDIVTMLSTANQGYVYSILKEGNKRHVYVVQLSTPAKFTQVAAYKDIQAPNFAEATQFAASSQYPIIYYAHQNKVYALNLPTGQAQEVLVLPANQEITMLKFNLYEDPFGSGNFIGMGFLKPFDGDTRNVYLAREKQLIVGAFNNAAEDASKGGILQFYNVGSDGTELTLFQSKDEKDQTFDWSFEGFARIKDVRYKEKG